MKIEIKSLTKEFASRNSNDLLALEKFWKEIGDTPWDVNNLMHEIPLKWFLSHVAIADGKIVGYQVGSLKGRNAFLNKIVVDSEYRGKGIARKLLLAFLYKCKEKDFERIKFRVRTDNKAVEFYKKMGFIPNEELDYKREDGIASYFFDIKIGDILK